MGNQVARPGGGGKRQMPQHAAQKIARKSQKNRGPDAMNKLPQGMYLFLDFCNRLIGLHRKKTCIEQKKCFEEKIVREFSKLFLRVFFCVRRCRLKNLFSF